jgi:DNA polymerase III epsilon subunit-like protein
MKIIVYDTETTGLPKKTSKPVCIEEEHNYPHIVQFSYIVYDSETDLLLKIYDNIIKIPEHVVISPESINLHHITREIMTEQGLHISNALGEFLEDCMNSDIIVGHNISFDNTMVKIELLRNMSCFNESSVEMFTKCDKFYCTMKNTIDLCAIKTSYKNSTKTYNKFPKLIELYTHLFAKTPSKLHNSLNDVVLCLQCFCKLMFKRDICQHNTIIREMVDNTM